MKHSMSTPMIMTISGKQHKAVSNQLQPAPGLISRARQYLDRRRLNHDLAKWLTAATNFKANGLPAGSPAYQQLYDRSCERIQRYAASWETPPDRILVEVPALYSLQKLAHPPARPASHPIALFIAVVAIFFGLAALLGASDGIFHLVEKVIAR